MPHEPGAGGPALRLARSVAERPRPLPLVGRLQPYAWGGHDFLRQLTGLDHPPGAPAAEWWIGAHPLAPSIALVDDEPCGLDALIGAAPESLLGPLTSARFGPRLPFLLKVLDVRQMLSIQAHPDKAQAQEGFARENALGIPVDAPHRNYRDDNHKPEAQVALTKFWLLCGFRPLAEIAALLAARPQLGPLAARLVQERAGAGSAAPDAAIVRSLYEHVMRMPQAEIDAMIGSLAARLAPLYRGGRLDRGSPDFWAARAVEQFALAGGHHDRGVLSIYLLNLLQLAPGEGTFLGAGQLHAYLEGAAVEIMANSDNVLRGGLTPKHVDAPELLRVLQFEPRRPEPLIATAVGEAERRYRTPTPEFGLSRLEPRPRSACTLGTSPGPEILIVLEGALRLAWSGGSLDVPRGAAVFVPADVACRAEADAPSLAFRAGVGDP